MGKEVPLADSQKIVALNEFILREHGFKIKKDAHILDFGCGSGRHTYEYLEADYRHVVGFDIRNYVELCQQTDHQHFHFSAHGKKFTLPFPDDSFDFIMSTSVFEHVLDQPETIAEIARVLKLSGVTLHIFPSRCRPVECHIFVPLGGVIQARWWLRIWASLGVRNGYQRGLTAAFVVEKNTQFCKADIHYPPFKELDNDWRSNFGCVIYAEKAFIEASTSISVVSRLMNLILKFLPNAIAAYRGANTRVVLASEPRKR